MQGAEKRRRHRTPKLVHAMRIRAVRSLAASSLQVEEAELGLVTVHLEWRRGHCPEAWPGRGRPQGRHTGCEALELISTVCKCARRSLGAHVLFPKLANHRLIALGSPVALHATLGVHVVVCVPAGPCLALHHAGGSQALHLHACHLQCLALALLLLLILLLLNLHLQLQLQHLLIGRAHARQLIREPTQAACHGTRQGIHLSLLISCLLLLL